MYVYDQKVIVTLNEKALSVRKAEENSTITTVDLGIGPIARIAMIPTDTDTESKVVAVTLDNKVYEVAILLNGDGTLSV
jgi:hypothetical protein